MSKLIDLTGKEFGFLKVLRRASSEESPNNSRVYWVCECQHTDRNTGVKCGKQTVVSGSKLKNGSVKSCGCAKGDLIRKKRRFYNSYEIEGDRIKVFIQNKEFFVIDLEDLHFIEDAYWYKNKKGYIVSDNYFDKRVRLNRVLLNVTDKKYVVDHWDGNPLNNAKSNLRICTQGENVLNAFPTNLSGANGVRKTENGRWTSNIIYHGKYIRIGTFDTIEEAVKARIDKEKELFGDYSFFNRPNENMERDTNLGDMLKNGNGYR